MARWLSGTHYLCPSSPCKMLYGLPMSALVPFQRKEWTRWKRNALRKILSMSTVIHKVNKTTYTILQLWVLNVSFSNKRDFLLWLPEKVTAQQQHNSFSSGKSTSARLWGTRVCLQFLKLMIFPLCMCVVQFFLHCFFKSIFIVETKTNSVVWEIFHCRFFALVALHFQKCQAVLCYILIDE